ncbi:E3 ubiquitin-protein ligase E3D [Episyrphus balteatus]|uniref:E3 ubiquitin-protein ligase E3D n=1 Tax=Episyrphus balteatus TaxID=286459 RepID=UPI0024857E3A|nr:E3 ubiquitin-protein ligase E3D [Episyrphus balteatus]XP_055844893.1 E3 ubiquitin-protein ligase E3D [Episyrphus balteatus]
MSLKCVTLEVRKNLRCANVFLEFDHSLTETEFVKIQIDENSIKLREYSTETTIALQGHLTIQAPSLSSLVVEENNASFRMNIDTPSPLWPIKNDNDQKFTKQIPDVTPLAKVTLTCSRCQSILTKDDVQFERILEFPSGTIDVGEFFCHHGPDLNSVLIPKRNDMFYGLFFVILNAECLKGIRIKENNAFCGRCLMHLGETLFDNKALKIWTDTLKEAIFKPRDIESMVSQLMARILDECSIGNNLHIMQFSKAIVEAIMPTRKKKYILLNILERNLDILRNQTISTDGFNNNTGMVKLDKCKANKVLYQFHNEDDKSSMLKSWLQDISVHTTKISPTLFSALQRRLERNSKLLPEVYRYSNEFILSYVFY